MARETRGGKGESSVFIMDSIHQDSGVRLNQTSNTCWRKDAGSQARNLLNGFVPFRSFPVFNQCRCNLLERAQSLRLTIGFGGSFSFQEI